MNTMVAVPTNAPGGLDADLSAHFGHCDVFTVAKIEDGQIKEVGLLPNIPHTQGGCLGPVNHLAGNGIKILLSGGMGIRPLMGFNDVGIDVYFNGGLANVAQALDAFVSGKLPRFGQEMTCGGGHDHSQTGGCSGH